MNQEKKKWSLSFPQYPFGVLADAEYTANYGTDSAAEPIPSNYKMALVSETDQTDLNSYLSMLKSEGCKIETVATATADQAISAYWISKGDERMYVYHSVNAGEIRFVIDRGEVVSAQDISYSYEKKPSDSTVLYQYGLTMSKHAKNVGELIKHKTDAEGNYILDGEGKRIKLEKDQYVLNTETSNCGQFYIIKLADNSLFIIDGAGYFNMPENVAAELNSFLHEITETPEDSIVRISAWLITHSHGDHYGGLARFLMNYHSLYSIERICFNFNFRDPCMPRFLKENLLKWYPDIKFHRPHTREQLRFADVTLDILYTYEDSISAKTGSILLDDIPLLWGGTPYVDTNNSSMVAKIDIGGKSFLMTGDMVLVAQGAIMKNYSPKYLQSDILQVSHHGLNPLNDLYPVVKPSITLYPQMREAARVLNALTEGVYNSVVQCTQGGLENIYFQGNCSVGISADSGELKVVYMKEDFARGIWDKEDMFYIYKK